MKLHDILVNKKYTSGSLYGYGIFPYWLYVKFIGKPIYKFMRRRKVPVFHSLMAANIIGSGFHVGWFSDGILDIAPFIISLLTMAYTFQTMNNDKPFHAVGGFLFGLGAWTTLGWYLGKICLVVS